MSRAERSASILISLTVDLVTTGLMMLRFIAEYVIITIKDKIKMVLKNLFLKKIRRFIIVSRILFTAHFPL